MDLSNAALTKAVNDAFTTSSGIPDGHKGAFLTVVDKDGLTAVLAHKIDQHWIVTAQVKHPWQGANQFGATIQSTW